MSSRSKILIDANLGDRGFALCGKHRMNHSRLVSRGLRGSGSIASNRRQGVSPIKALALTV
jgi:hypothetical protein